MHVLWADALCIDQSDPKERADQVGIMGLLYARATTVVIWLGEDTEGIAQECVDLMRKMNSAVELKILDEELRPEPQLAIDNAMSRLSDDTTQDIFPKTLILCHVYDRPWFSRMWVLQEISLASAAVVYYGAVSIQLSEVVQATMILAYRRGLGHGLAIGALLDGFRVIVCSFGKMDTWILEKIILSAYRDHLHRQKPPGLISVLRCGARFNASDARDHIYAFSGHPAAKSTGGEESIIEADYTITVEDVCKKVAQSLYCRDRRLDFLTVIEHYPWADLDASPSWVPRFDMKIGTFPFDHSAYDAQLAVETKSTCTVAFRGNDLLVEGLLFDSIEESTEMFNKYQYTIMSPSPVELCWYKAVKASSAMYNQPFLALCITLVSRNYAGRYEQLMLDVATYCDRKGAAELRALAEEARSSFDRSTVSDGNWMRFEATAQSKMTGRKFFVTKRGLFGIGPALLRPGDICGIIFGCNMPTILRKTAQQDHYHCLGTSYINGVMDGQAVRYKDDAGLQTVNITLV